MATQDQHVVQDEIPGIGQLSPRARHLLTLEFGSKEQFDDPRLEWRRLFSEMLGTFMLVLVAAGGGILHGEGQISLAAAVVAPGLMVMAIILFMGAVSGAHLNPGVSLAFAMRGDFPWKRVPGYIIVQLVGATLASLFLLAVFGNIQHLGATLPGPGYANWQALLMEVVLTAVLVSVILGTASAAQNVGAIAALGVGGYIALAGLWSAPVSGTSMNPARSFGPALVSGDFSSYWVYVLGPIAGAVIAVGCAFVLRGRGGDPTSSAAGSGALGAPAQREDAATR
jgi:aquaporin Z